MERISGIPISNVEALKAAGVDMRRLAHNGVKIFFTQAFRDGFFHADMHPGNIFVTVEGQYRAVDFGIMGSLGEQDKRSHVAGGYRRRVEQAPGSRTAVPGRAGGGDCRAGVRCTNQRSFYRFRSRPHRFGLSRTGSLRPIAGWVRGRGQGFATGH